MTALRTESSRNNCWRIVAATVGVAMAFLPIGAEAQRDHLPRLPEESQAVQITQTIGLDEVTLSYSRPNLKGRAMFGAQLPWGSVWRVGANDSTKIAFDDEMLLAGHRVPPGTYSLLAIPRPDRWTIILNEDTTLWGHYGYQPAKDHLRFDVRPSRGHELEETLVVHFVDVDPWSAKLEIRWGELRVRFRVEPDREAVARRILADIQEKVGNPAHHTNAETSSLIYLVSADYYLKNELDLEQAAEWAAKAIGLHPDKFYFLTQTRILGALHRYDEAIAAAQRGLELFASGDNEEWKWRYRDAIDSWQAAKRAGRGRSN